METSIFRKYISSEEDINVEIKTVDGITYQGKIFDADELGIQLEAKEPKEETFFLYHHQIARIKEIAGSTDK